MEEVRDSASPMTPKGRSSKLSLGRRSLLIDAAALGGLALVGGGAAAAARGSDLLVTSTGRARPAWAVAELKAIDPADYPGLSDVEHGLMRWMQKKANLPKGDWSMWESGIDEGRAGMEGDEADGAQYDGFWTAQAVAVTSMKTPAYRELYQNVLGGLVDKMLDSHVWAYWSENRHSVSNNGRWMPYAADPVKTGNAMYLSFFSGTLGYYGLVTNDLKYETEPMAFVYEGPGKEVVPGQPVKTGDTWYHTWTEMQSVIKSQTDVDPNRMLPCQLPIRYLFCNLGIQMGFLAHDRVHGTETYSAASWEPGGFWDVVGEKWFFPARSTGLPMQRIQFGHHPTIGAINLGITKAYPGYVNQMVGTNPAYAREAYAFAKSKMYTPAADGTAQWLNPAGGKFLFSTVRAASSARFMGDPEAADATLGWIEKTCGPTWEGDMLHYTFGYTAPADIARAGHAMSQVLQGYSAQEGGTLSLYSEDRSRFSQPTLAGVEYPAVKVGTATYDSVRETLVVAVDATKQTSVRVENLRPRQHVKVVIDRVRVIPLKADAQGTITVEVPAGKRSIVVGTAAPGNS